MFRGWILCSGGLLWNSLMIFLGKIVVFLSECIFVGVAMKISQVKPDSQHTHRIANDCCPNRMDFYLSNQ